MKKALHLEADNLHAIGLDGDALKITMKDQSALRFPLCRLSRITICGSFYFPIEDLIQCVNKQIFVTFLNKRGRVRAQLLPYQQQSTPLIDYLEQVSFCSGFQDVFNTWKDVQLKHVLRQLGMENGVAQCRNRQHQEALIRAVKVLGCRQEYQEGVSWLLGFYRTHCNQVLQHFGLPVARPELQILKMDLEYIFLPMLRDNCAEQLRADIQAGNRNYKKINAHWALCVYHLIEEQISAMLPLMLNSLLRQFEEIDL